MTNTRLLPVAIILAGFGVPCAAEQPVEEAYARFRPVDLNVPSPKHFAEISTSRYFQAESPVTRYERGRRRWKKAWIASWVAYAAVNLIDAHSSQGHAEANPLLRGSNGSFSGGKAAAVKGALGAGFFLWQHRMIRKNPERNYHKTFTFATAGAAGAMGAVAAHNYTLD